MLTSKNYAAKLASAEGRSPRNFLGFLTVCSSPRSSESCENWIVLRIDEQPWGGCLFEEQQISTTTARAERSAGEQRWTDDAFTGSSLRAPSGLPSSKDPGIGRRRYGYCAYPTGTQESLPKRLAAWLHKVPKW